MANESGMCSDGEQETLSQAKWKARTNIQYCGLHVYTVACKQPHQPHTQRCLIFKRKKGNSYVADMQNSFALFVMFGSGVFLTQVLTV